MEILNLIPKKISSSFRRQMQRLALPAVMPLTLALCFSLVPPCARAALFTKTGDTADAQIKTFNDLIEQSKRSCESSTSFIEAFEFLKNEKELDLNEARSLQLALDVSKGCTGAADRFKRTYSILKKSGVDLKRAIEVGLQFSTLSDERAQNFEVVFKKMFLENYFDFDFPTAYKVSFEMSSELKEKIKSTGEDFSRIVKFCMDNKSLSLPIRECAQYTLVLVRSSKLFPFGLFRDFERLYSFLTTGDGVKLPVKDALATCVDVLQFGPTAVNNFIKTYEYALAKDKMQLDQRQALKLALLVSQNSITSLDSTSTEAVKK